jgi:two-component system NarL family sensor kinase
VKVWSYTVYTRTVREFPVEISLSPLETEHGLVFSSAIRDITQRKAAQDAARQLSARLLQMQDEERRRIARGLHDSLGQYLTALKMNLDLLSTTDKKRIAAECSEMVDKCLAETRTISHLLHPPLLDEAGLGSAIRWYVEGFAQRSGIKVKLELPSQFGRLHREVETALFRSLQEGLTNVHRHSGSSVVDIRLIVDTKQVRLEIKDKGQGIPPKTLKRLVEGIAYTGVGLAGIRERMRELGGSLRIKSDKDGTLLRVTIPISEMSTKPVDGDATKGVSAV